MLFSSIIVLVRPSALAGAIRNVIVVECPGQHSDELSHVELPGGTEHLIPVLIRPRSHHDPVVICLQDGVIGPKVGKDIDERGIGGVDAGDGDEDECEDSECRCQKFDVDFGFH